MKSQHIKRLRNDRNANEMMLQRANLDIEANRQVHYFATASIAGWAYPSLWVSTRRLDRFYECSEPPIREAVVRLLADACFSPPITPPKTLCGLIEANQSIHDPRIEMSRRIYVALTEVFNHSVREIFITREWLDPWSPWKYFLVAPWDIQEETYVKLCAAVFNISPEEVEGHCLGCETIHRFVVYLADHDPVPQEAPLSASLLLSEFQRQFAYCLRAYVHKGAISWTMRFGRYRI